MELKLSLMRRLSAAFILLIVPYGIETMFINRFFSGVVLLIVPYGIETCLTVENLGLSTLF